MQALNLVTPREKKRRRGNRNWGNGVPVVGPAQLTEWDLLLEALGIDEAGVEAQPAVRRFVRRHAKRCYIPEAVLAACGALDAAFTELENSR